MSWPGELDSHRQTNASSRWLVCDRCEHRLRLPVLFPPEWSYVDGKTYCQECTRLRRLEQERG